MLEKQDLFEARKDGYHVCRVPGILAAKNETVLVTTEARPGKGGDWDFNDILMRRSTDGGKTFEPAVKIVESKNYGDGLASNFVLTLDEESGRIVAVFAHDYARVLTMCSDDDGATFTDPAEITDERG